MRGHVATTFRNFPSYPQIYLDPLAEQPHGPETPEIVRLRRVSQPRLYTLSVAVRWGNNRTLELASLRASAAETLSR